MSKILSILTKDNREPLKYTSNLGAYGEALGVDFLIKSGYRIVLTNFKVPVGRNSKGVQVTGEIDIIALDDQTLCFIEVKTRRSEEFAPVLTAVNRRKQRQIIRTAKIYRRIFGLRNIEFRYDVITVLSVHHSDPEIALIKGFWTEDEFRKKRWEQPAWSDFF